MKFIVDREHLLKPLQQVTSPVPNRPTIPILKNLLIQVSNDMLSLTGSNIEIEITTRIILSRPHNAGAVTVPARKFFDICRNLPEGSEILAKLEGDRILICSGQIRFLLSTLPISQFPNFEYSKSIVEFTLPQVTMKWLIEATQFSMAHQDVRYYLNGMLFETKGEELHTVATDGYRLAVCSTPIRSSLLNHSAIIPRKGVIELMRILDSFDTPLYIQISTNNIRIDLGNFVFTSKLIDGQFPEYRHALQKNPDKRLEVKRDTLKQAFIRTAILSNERFRGIRLCLSKKQIKITASNAEQEEAEEIIDGIYFGDEMEIGLNVNYVLDVLNALKCEKVCILLTDSTSSIQIGDALSDAATYVIMPMRL